MIFTRFSPSLTKSGHTTLFVRIIEVIFKINFISYRKTKCNHQRFFLFPLAHMDIFEQLMDNSRPVIKKGCFQQPLFLMKSYLFFNASPFVRQTLFASFSQTFPLKEITRFFPSFLKNLKTRIAFPPTSIHLLNAKKRRK